MATKDVNSDDKIQRQYRLLKEWVLLITFILHYNTFIIK